MSHSKPKPGKSLPPLDPALFEPPEMLAALAVQDIGAVYRLLKAAGVSQRQIAARTGQSQSEVCEIMQGREVIAYKVLARICDGLGVPRHLMGLSRHGPDGAYAGSVDGVPVDDAPEGVNAEMRRRSVVGALSIAVIGAPLGRFGERLAELGLAGGEPVPARLETSHVRTVRATTERLRGLAREHGGQADLFAAAARHYRRWLDSPATDTVRARFLAAVSELHTEAGWCAYDSGTDGAGYFTRAARLADEAGDVYAIADAAYQAGATMIRAGAPDDALKCFQLGQFQLAGHTKARDPGTVRGDDPRIPAVAARLDAASAGAYALLDHPKQARDFLAKARDGKVEDGFVRAALDLSAALALRDLGRLDAAEASTQTAARGFGAQHARCATMAGLLRAELHVRAGEPRGTGMAKTAIEQVAGLRSASLRSIYLPPLADALAAQPGGDARELARMARRVAAVAA